MIVVVTNPVGSWSKNVRRHPPIKIIEALTKFSNGDWGTLDPAPLEHNETAVRESISGSSILGIYGDIVVVGTLRQPQLPDTLPSVNEPKVMTVSEAANDPEVCALILQHAEVTVS